MSEWTSINSMFPEKVGGYLAWSTFGFAYVFYLGPELLFRDMQTGTLSGHYNSDFKAFFEVTHWMPLPEPPK